jgi:hypothetical protein
MVFNVTLNNISVINIVLQIDVIYIYINLLCYIISIIPVYCFIT